MNITWFSACVEGGHSKFMSTKNWSPGVEELITIVASSVNKSLTFKKKSKDKYWDNLDSDDESEHFNFEKLEIIVDPDL